jgi:alpha-1,6-mannosyltransferase
MRKILLQHCGTLLLICLFFYSCLSWVLFFRDGRALIAISHFYPAISSKLYGIQIFLSHHNLNTVPTILFLIFAVCAFFIYFLSIKQNINLRITVIFSLLFGLVIFFSYPVLSTDIFSYIFSDRIATVYHQNVWTVLPITHNSDPFAIMADWKNTTSIYGAVNHLIYTVPSVLGGNNFILLVIMYKLVSVIFAIGIMVILYMLLKSAKSNTNNIARNIRVVFWNPLFLLEIFGSGHNDSIMIFFTLLASYFFNKKNYVIAGLALACAVQIKLIPVLLFVFFAIYLFQKEVI